MLQFYPSRLLVCVSLPASEPIALADAKLYLRVSITDDDTLIAGLITAARMVAEETMRRSLITQSWKLAYDGCLLLSPHWRLPQNYFLRTPMVVRLPRGPVNSITSITAFAQDNSSTTIDPSTYTMDAAQDAVVFYMPPIAARRVEIVYATGYGSSGSNVPQPIIDGMLAHIGMMYDQRGEASADLPPQSVALFSPYRDMRL